MKNIVYRNLEKGDYLQVKRLINSVWKFERFSNDAKTAENLLELYTRKTLIEQNYAKVAVCEDEIVGPFCSPGKREARGFLRNLSMFHR